MDTLAYLHLALVYEESIGNTQGAEELAALLAEFQWQRWAGKAGINLLALLLGAGILGAALAAQAEVRVGDSGAEVTEVQRRLQELGYFNRQPTGYFRKVTKAAVMQFQRRNDLYASGVADDDTIAVLFSDTAIPANVMVSPMGTYPAPYLPSSLILRPEERPILRMGDRDPSVISLKQRLLAQGYNCGSSDDAFDRNTETQLRQFQRDRQLTVNGIADPRTWQALSACNCSNVLPIDNRPSASNFYPSGSRNILKLWYRGQDVASLQESLQFLGYFQEQISGYFDRQTQAAVRRFQRDNRLQPSGDADLTTQAAIDKQVQYYSSQPYSQPYGNNLRILSRGLRGSDVTYLQQRLKSLNLYRGEVDGSFGYETYQAVRKFQRSAGLSPNGTVDWSTWSALSQYSTEWPQTPSTTPLLSASF